MNPGSSTPQSVVTTQNRDPWSGAQPYLGEVLSQASGLYHGGVGYQPYMGQTVADLSPYQNTGILHGLEIAQNNPWGTPNNTAAQNLAGNIIGSQGMIPGINNAIGGEGGLQQAAQKLYQMSGDPTSWQQYNSIYSDANGQQNPYLQGVLDTQGRKIADQVNSSMSGAGRYGSGAHTNVLSRNLAEAQLPLLAQDYQNRQQTRLAATQGQQNALAQQMAATQGQAGIQGQIADLYGQGLNRAGQYSQLAPSLDQAAYMPSQMMQQLGSIYSQRAQQQLSDTIGQYNAQQSFPWEQLARFSAIANGAGGLGGSQITTSPNLNAPAGGLTGALGGALGGAALGGSIFGPAGAAAGGLGGGLLGYLR